MQQLANHLKLQTITASQPSIKAANWNSKICKVEKQEQVEQTHELEHGFVDKT